MSLFDKFGPIEKVGDRCWYVWDEEGHVVPGVITRIGKDHALVDLDVGDSIMGVVVHPDNLLPMSYRRRNNENMIPPTAKLLGDDGEPVP